jgi:alpha-tubulin suppressor-like RCC1 family protein
MLFAWGLVSDSTVLGKAVSGRRVASVCLQSTGFNPPLQPLLHLFHNSDVHSVACSWSCTWSLYNDGRVHQQRLPQCLEPVASLDLVCFPQGTCIKQVSAGEGHCLALCAAGNLWCWGDNSSGQCGAPAAPQPSTAQSTVQGHGRYGSSHSDKALNDTVTSPVLVLGPGADEEHARCHVLQVGLASYPASSKLCWL